MKHLIILTFLFIGSFAYAASDEEECIFLGQLAGSVAVDKAQGVAREDIWKLYEQRGVPAGMRPVIEALANVAYDPENSDADAADFVKYVTMACLEDRKKND